MKNILIEHTRAPKMVHFMVKSYIPVFERIVTEETWRSDKLGDPRYIKGQENFYSMPTPTSIPQKMWPLVRIRRARTGQLRLL